jgi:hypothetical protein
MAIDNDPQDPFTPPFMKKLQISFPPRDQPPSFDNASEPDPSTVEAGYMIFNTDENILKVSDGTNWRDMNGNLT